MCLHITLIIYSSLPNMGLRWAYTVAAAAVVVGLVVGGGLGFPAEDLVKKLPGQPTVTFKQYAGYVDVGVENNKRSLFYYFVEAEGNPNYKPLTLWLNGGPGCSSVGGGAFTELGPFYPSGNGRGLITNPKSWNKVSNLLFVESPVGVGWSYSNTSSNHTIGDKLTARDMFDFLLTWYTKFPIFRNRALFLTGESYAGHYIPQLADLLLYHNEHSSIPVNLKGIALGNPLLKLDRDVPAMYDYMWSHGLISDEIRDTIMDICDFEDYSLTIHNNKTQGRCYDALDAAYAVGSVTDVYGVIYDQCYPSIVEQELRLGKMATKMSLGVDVCKTYERDFYFNLPQVQRALHANVTGLPYMWSICTVNPQLNYNYTDQDTDMVPLLKRILESKIPLLIYSGDQDLVVPLQGSRKIVRELAHDMKFNITDSYRAWFHEEQVGGWVTEYGKQLTFATVRGASHMVPYTQSSRALGLFASFVGGRRLPNTTQYSH